MDAPIDGTPDAMTNPSSRPVHRAPRGDLAIQRSIVRVEFEVYRDCQRLPPTVDNYGEPPLVANA